MREPKLAVNKRYYYTYNKEVVLSCIEFELYKRKAIFDEKEEAYDEADDLTRIDSLRVLKDLGDMDAWIDELEGMYNFVKHSKKREFRMIIYFNDKEYKEPEEVEDFIFNRNEEFEIFIRNTI